jgi:enamine deaminase RidA (YjgF/YER057c/UK114 family)
LGLELNPLASNSTNSQKINVLGFSHLPSLVSKGYFIIYTTSNLAMDYEESTNHYRIDQEVASDFAEENSQQLPKYSLVVVSASSVISSQKPKEDEEGRGTKCSAQEQWNQTMEEIEELIESNFKPSRWHALKSLAKEILKNKNWCVYVDGRYFHVKGKPKTKVPLLDFLGEVTKQVFGSDKTEKPEYKKFRLYVRELRARGVSSTLLRNKNI